MTNVLLFIQHSNGALLKATLAALSAARALRATWGKGEIYGVAVGSGATTAATAAAALGIAKVYVAEEGRLERYIAPAYEAVVLAAVAAAGADTLVAPATSTGKDLAPRLAAALDAGQASDIVGVNSDGSLRRPTYAGNAFADVEILSPKKVVTVRATAFQPAAAEGQPGTVETLSFSLDGIVPGEVVGYEMSKADRPQLGDASIVVSGGRALQSAENFEKYVFPLADALGAAVGASRAAVDSGYAPNDWQVGQTGKVVAPTLYLAVGISGAIQHLAGMKDSKVIAAINKDPEAPIFEVADYGLVGDLFQIVPALTEAIKRAK